MKPDWDMLSENAHSSVFVADVNCQKEESLCSDFHTGGNYPTIIIFRRGKTPELYQGGRGYEDLMKFVDKELAQPCNLKQVEETCDAKEQKYISKWRTRDTIAVTTELSRLESIDVASMTFDLSRWRNLRVVILRQLKSSQPDAGGEL